MKDYSVLRETLNVLVEVQEMLTERLEQANKRFYEAEQETAKYTTDNEGNVVYTDTDGLIETGRSRWDMEYADRCYKETKRNKEAIEAVIDYMDKYKL